MNVQRLIEQYIAFRQSLGAHFQTNAKILRAFGRSIGKGVDVTEVSPRQFQTFLDGKGPITSGWHNRLKVLRGFYHYALSRGYVAVTPLPTLVPKRPPDFVPYIYSQAELRRLLQQTAVSQCRRHQIEPETLHAILLLLYGAGLRVGEAVSLKCVDVDLADALVTIRRTKFDKSRLVPMGPKLCQALAAYAKRRGKGAGSRLAREGCGYNGINASSCRPACLEDRR